MANLVLDNVGMRYQSTAALTGVNLQIADGEFVSIVGSSGSGKSTLLRIIAGLERQTSGHVMIGGRCVDGMRSADRDIAMVFQSYALYPHLSAFANIAMPLTVTRLSPLQRLPIFRNLSPRARAVRKQIASDVASVASMLGIDKLLDRKPGQLSGGQRQRIALGRAIVRHPEIFLMDEPLSNLDAALRVQMRAELVALHRRLGTTFVYVTHDQTEALTMSDRVALMADGELLQVGTPAEIYERPQTLKVARFIGSPRMNILPATVSDRRAQHATIAVLVDTIADGMTAHLGIRPEDFRLGNSGSPFSIAGTVTFVERAGADMFLHLAAGDGQEPVIARLGSKAGQGIAVGNTVHLIVDPKDILVFDAEGRLTQAGAGSLASPKSAKRLVTA